MNSLIINKKKYIVIEQEKFEELQQRAAQKTTSAQKLTLLKGKLHAYKLVDKWGKGK